MARVERLQKGRNQPRSEGRGNTGAQGWCNRRLGKKDLSPREETWRVDKGNRGATARGQGFNTHHCSNGNAPRQSSAESGDVAQPGGRSQVPHERDTAVASTLNQGNQCFKKLILNLQNLLT